MVELFSSPDSPGDVLVIPFESNGLYGVHPPRHLRIHVACDVLERAGFHQDAKEILERWHQKNGLDQEKGAPIVAWLAGQYVYLPFTAFHAMTKQITERLYEGPFQSLSGFGLSDISGLDFGPHEHNEAVRAKNALLDGRVPSVRDARAVIGGAVLAAVQAPEREAVILEKARRAIVGVGTFEHAPDAFNLDAAESLAGAARAVGPLELSPRSIAEAFILREVLARPRRGARQVR